MLFCRPYGRLAGLHSNNSSCGWSHMRETVCAFWYTLELKAGWQRLWLILHVKLKLAPPEHCNKLQLGTTTCPEMTAGHAPIPINPYFTMYSAHLLAFFPAKASPPSHTRAGFILYRTTEQFQRERERKSFYMEKWGDAGNETGYISLTRAHSDQRLFDFSLHLTVFTKKCVHTKRIQQQTAFLTWFCSC